MANEKKKKKGQQSLSSAAKTVGTVVKTVGEKIGQAAVNKASEQSTAKQSSSGQNSALKLAGRTAKAVAGAVSSYHQAANPAAKKKWYSGEQPTGREAVARMYEVSGNDKTRFSELYKQYEVESADKGSIFYNPYTQATNTKAIEGLTALGYDVGDVDSFLANNKWLLNYGRETTTSYGPASPTNKSTDLEKAAYWYRTLQKADEDTVNAETEMSQLASDIGYLVERGYSDDAILAMTKKDFSSNYKTLAEMDDDRIMGDATILNRAVNYNGDDTLYGMIWAARNDDTSGDYFADSVKYTMGLGNKYVYDANSEAARDPSNYEQYNPYAMGSNLTEWNKYTGVSYIDDTSLDVWRESMLAMDASDDDRKLWQSAYEANENTKAAKSELSALDTFVEEQYAKGRSADDICAMVTAMIDPEDGKVDSDYTTLGKMESKRKMGSYLELGDTVDFTLPTYLQKIRSMEGSIEQAEVDPSTVASDYENYNPYKSYTVDGWADAAGEEPMTREYLDAHREWLDDEDLAKVWRAADTALDNGEKAQEELDELDGWLANKVKRGWSAERIVEALDEELGSYATLSNMEESRERGEAYAVAGVDFTKPEYIKKIYEATGEEVPEQYAQIGATAEAAEEEEEAEEEASTTDQTEATAENKAKTTPAAETETETETAAQTEEGAKPGAETETVKGETQPAAKTETETETAKEETKPDESSRVEWFAKNYDTEKTLDEYMHENFGVNVAGFTEDEQKQWTQVRNAMQAAKVTHSDDSEAQRMAQVFANRMAHVAESDRALTDEQMQRREDIQNATGNLKDVASFVGDYAKKVYKNTAYKRTSAYQTVYGTGEDTAQGETAEQAAEAGTQRGKQNPTAKSEESEAYIAMCRGGEWDAQAYDWAKQNSSNWAAVEQEMANNIAEIRRGNLSASEAGLAGSWWNRFGHLFNTQEEKSVVTNTLMGGRVVKYDPRDNYGETISNSLKNADELFDDGEGYLSSDDYYAYMIGMSGIIEKVEGIAGDDLNAETAEAIVDGSYARQKAEEAQRLAEASGDPNLIGLARSATKDVGMADKIAKLDAQITNSAADVEREEVALQEKQYKANTELIEALDRGEAVDSDDLMRLYSSVQIVDAETVGKSDGTYSSISETLQDEITVDNFVANGKLADIDLTPVEGVEDGVTLDVEVTHQELAQSMYITTVSNRANDILNEDMKYASVCGMTLEEYYRHFPEEAKTADSIIEQAEREFKEAYGTEMKQGATALEGIYLACKAAEEDEETQTATQSGVEQEVLSQKEIDTVLTGVNADKKAAEDAGQTLGEYYHDNPKRKFEVAQMMNFIPTAMPGNTVEDQEAFQSGIKEFDAWLEENKDNIRYNDSYGTYVETEADWLHPDGRKYVNGDIIGKPMDVMDQAIQARYQSMSALESVVAGIDLGVKGIVGGLEKAVYNNFTLDPNDETTQESLRRSYNSDAKAYKDDLIKTVEKYYPDGDEKDAVLAAINSTENIWSIGMSTTSYKWKGRITRNAQEQAEINTMLQRYGTEGDRTVAEITTMAIQSGSLMATGQVIGAALAPFIGPTAGVVVGTILGVTGEAADMTYSLREQGADWDTAALVGGLYQLINGLTESYMNLEYMQSAQKRWVMTQFVNDKWWHVLLHNPKLFMQGTWEVLKTYGIDGVGETIQEWTQDVAEKELTRLTLGQPLIQPKTDIADAKHTAKLTFINSILMSGLGGGLGSSLEASYINERGDMVDYATAKLNPAFDGGVTNYVIERTTTQEAIDQASDQILELANSEEVKARDAAVTAKTAAQVELNSAQGVLDQAVLAEQNAATAVKNATDAINSAETVTEDMTKDLTTANQALTEATAKRTEAETKVNAAQSVLDKAVATFEAAEQKVADKLGEILNGAKKTAREIVLDRFFANATEEQRAAFEEYLAACNELGVQKQRLAAAKAEAQKYFAEGQAKPNTKRGQRAITAYGRLLTHVENLQNNVNILADRVNQLYNNTVGQYDINGDMEQGQLSPELQAERDTDAALDAAAKEESAKQDEIDAKQKELEQARADLAEAKKQAKAHPKAGKGKYVKAAETAQQKVNTLEGELSTLQNELHDIQNRALNGETQTTAQDAAVQENTQETAEQAAQDAVQEEAVAEEAAEETTEEEAEPTEFSLEETENVEQEAKQQPEQQQPETQETEEQAAEETKEEKQKTKAEAKAEELAEAAKKDPVNARAQREADIANKEALAEQAEKEYEESLPGILQRLASKDPAVRKQAAHDFLNLQGKAVTARAAANAAKAQFNATNDAQAKLRSAIEDLKGYSNRALAYEGHPDHEGAQAAYDRVQEALMEVEIADARNNLSEVADLLKAGDNDSLKTYQEAEAALRKIIEAKDEWTGETSKRRAAAVLAALQQGGLDEVTDALQGREARTDLTTKLTDAVKADPEGLKTIKDIAGIKTDTTKLTVKGDTGATGQAGVTRAFADSLTNLTKDQDKQLTILDMLGKDIGVEIVVHPTVSTVEGAVNGAYLEGNVIHVGLDALDQGYVQAGFHEVTHWIAKNNESAFRGLSFVVTEALKANGVDVNALINERIEQYARAGEIIDSKAALEEIVAESCGLVLTNEQNMKTFAAEHASAFKNVMQRFMQFWKKLKGIAQSIANKNQRGEMQALIGKDSDLQKIYDNFMKAAKETGVIAQQTKAENVDSVVEQLENAVEEIAQEEAQTEAETEAQTEQAPVERTPEQLEMEKALEGVDEQAARDYGFIDDADEEADINQVLMDDAAFETEGMESSEEARTDGAPIDVNATQESTQKSKLPSITAILKAGQQKVGKLKKNGRSKTTGTYLYADEIGFYQECRKLIGDATNDFRENGYRGSGQYTGLSFQTDEFSDDLAAQIRGYNVNTGDYGVSVDTTLGLHTLTIESPESLKQLGNYLFNMDGQGLDERKLGDDIFQSKVKYSLNDLAATPQEAQAIATNVHETPSSEAKYSLNRDSELMNNSIELNNVTQNVSNEDMQGSKTLREKVAKFMVENFDRLGMPFKLDAEPEGETIYKNASYGVSVENSTLCPRSLALSALMDEIGEELGRPLTVAEQVYISQQVVNDKAFTADGAQCAYCYVMMDRMAYRETLSKYIDQRDAVLNDYARHPGKYKFDPNMTEEQRAKLKPYQSYLNGRKDTDNQWARFNMWVDAARNGSQLLQKEDLTNIGKLVDLEASNYAQIQNGAQVLGTRDETIVDAEDYLAQLKDALAYAQSASWAKKRVKYKAYNGSILKMSDQVIDELNKAYGMRFYSYSDASPAFILENLQMVNDASAKGAKGLGYTKVTWWARLFAPSGMNINVSVFGKLSADGTVVADEMMGANWEDTKQLRAQYKNVGAVFVATNDQLVEWALDQDWIDVVIPYHLVRTGDVVASLWNYKNYKQNQEDTKIKGKWDEEKGNVKSITAAMHGNDRKTYLDLCAANNLTPRFEKWLGHKNYMKLVNESRQSVKTSDHMQPITDSTILIDEHGDEVSAYDYITLQLELMAAEGGYTKYIGDSRLRGEEARAKQKTYAHQLFEKISDQGDRTAYEGWLAERSNKVAEQERTKYYKRNPDATPDTSLAGRAALIDLKAYAMAQGMSTKEISALVGEFLRNNEDVEPITAQEVRNKFGTRKQAEALIEFYTRHPDAEADTNGEVKAKQAALAAMTSDAKLSLNTGVLAEQNQRDMETAINYIVDQLVNNGPRAVEIAQQLTKLKGGMDVIAQARRAAQTQSPNGGQDVLYMKGDTQAAPGVTGKDRAAANQAQFMDQTTGEVTQEIPDSGVKNPVQIMRELTDSIRVGLNPGGQMTANGNERMPSSVAGFYNTRAKAITSRTTEASDLSVGLHEFGHAVQDRISRLVNPEGGTGLTATQEMIDALPETFRANYTPAELDGEAVAEFVCDYMYSRDLAVKTAGEAYVQNFEKMLRGDPTLLSAMNKARDQVTLWANASTGAKVKAMVSQTSTTQNRKHGLTRLLNDLNRAVFDSTAPASLVSENLRQAAQWSTFSSKRAGMILTDRLIDPQGNTIGDSLATRWANLGVDKSMQEDIEAFALARHALDRDMQGKPVFDRHEITRADLEAYVRDVEANNPQIVQAADALTEFWNDFFDAWFVQTGMVSKKTVDEMRKMYPHYVPTYRVQDRNMSTGSNVSSTFTLRAARGSSLEVVSPIASITNMVQQVVKTVSQNEVMRQFHREMQTGGYGWLATQETQDFTMTRVDTSKAEEKLTDLVNASGDIDVASVQDLYDTIVSMQEQWRGTGQNFGRNIVSGIDENGQRFFYRINDDYQGLYSLLSGTGDAQLTGKFWNVVRSVKNGFTQLTTSKNPFFLPKNIIRDMQASVNTGTWAVTYADGLVKWGAAFYDVVTNSEDYQSYVNMGGGQYTRFSNDTQTKVGQLMNALFKSGKKVTAKQVVKAAANVMTLSQLNEIAEATSRFAEYKYGKHDRTTFEGRREAFMAAQNATTNFGAHGASTAAKIANTVIPFCNATLQGLSKDINIIKDATSSDSGKRALAWQAIGKTALNVGLTAALQAALIGAFNGGDDDDDETAEEYGLGSLSLRTENFLIPTGSSVNPFIRIPIEQGPLARTIYGLALKGMSDISGMTQLDVDLYSMAKNIIRDTLPDGSIAQGLRDASNNTTYYGRQIVSDYVGKRSAPNQYNSDTLDVFKAASSALYSVGIEVSPAVMQYAAEQYSGVLGKVIIPVLSGNKYTGERSVEQSLQNLLEAGVKNFVADPVTYSDTQSNYSSAKETATSIRYDYQNGDTVYGLYSGLDEYEIEEAVDEATKMNKKGGIFYDADEEISELWDEISEIQQSEVLTDSEKATQIRVIRKEMSDIMLDALDEWSIYKMYYIDHDELAIAATERIRNGLN